MAKYKKVLLSVAAVLLVLFTVGLCFSGVSGAVSAEPKQYKNVILMIGDGMGENTLKAALNDDATPLFMETMPVRGQSETNSWPGFRLTDSAAGASALACGIRNINGEISTFAFDPLSWFFTPSTLSEMAIKNGKAAGVVTTDSTSGATPASFSAHAANRNLEKNISSDQLSSELNLIWGAVSESITKEKAEENGFTYLATKTDLQNIDSSVSSFAQFNKDDLKYTSNTDVTPTLDEMTVKAIDILDDDPDGFFLMVEAAHIDKFSHENEFEGAIHHVREFDKAIKSALDYAQENPDTLVLVTADHETGGITLENSEYIYTSSGHTKANVPVFVNRDDAGFDNGGVWKNREIGAQLGLILGFDVKEFPSSILPKR